METSASNEVIPLISGSTSGPLGLVHLPRLWLKLLLASLGRLPEGYRHGVGGADEIVFVGIGLDADATIAYIAAEKPDYLTFEAWVRANATNLSPEAIAQTNKNVLEGVMPDPRGSEWRARFGVDFIHGWQLNQLDDWAAIHAQVTNR
jgi:hypothetical protein